MEHLNGHVTVNDEPIGGRMYRFCEKQIGHWVLKAVEMTGGLRPEAVPEELPETQFRVEFTEEGEGPGPRQVSCVTEVTVRGVHWKGCDLAADSQQAFMHALKHMHLH